MIFYPRGERGRGRGKPLNTILTHPYNGDNMGRGPGSIYKICKAQALDVAKSLAIAEDKEDIISRANARYRCCTLLETDVKRVFFKENYSDKTTEKALRQWGDLSLTARRVYERYNVVLFLETLDEGA